MLNVLNAFILAISVSYSLGTNYDSLVCLEKVVKILNICMPVGLNALDGKGLWSRIWR